jgi:hypothetical protein
MSSSGALRVGCTTWKTLSATPTRGETVASRIAGGRPLAGVTPDIGRERRELRAAEPCRGQTDAVAWAVIGIADRNGVLAGHTPRRAALDPLAGRPADHATTPTTIAAAARTATARLKRTESRGLS